MNSNIGLELLEKVKNDTVDISQVDHEPSLEGRQLWYCHQIKKLKIWDIN